MMKEGRLARTRAYVATSKPGVLVLDTIEPIVMHPGEEAERISRVPMGTPEGTVVELVYRVTVPNPDPGTNGYARWGDE